MFLLLLLRQELKICINNFVITIHSTRTRHGRLLNNPHPLINYTAAHGSSGPRRHDYDINLSVFHDAMRHDRDKIQEIITNKTIT